MNRLLQAFLNLFNRKGTFLAILLSLNVLLHLPFLTLPPGSIHVWRQCNTLAVARNFYEEEMNILRPRVDRRFDTNGVTGMQFPSFEFGMALIAKVTGFHDSIARFLNLFIFSLGLWAFYELFFFFFRNRFSAAVGAWAMCWSPELFYHSINALPDVLALCASVGGLVLFLQWEKEKKPKHFWLSLLLLTLAGLTKLQYLAVGFPIAVLVLQGFFSKKYKAKDFGLLAIFGAVAVGVPLAWYAYARHLIDTSGLQDFGIELRPVNDWAVGLDILKDNLISDLPELMLNYAAFGLLLIGIVTFFKLKKHRSAWFWPIAVWSVGLMVYHIIELSQMTVHHYYMLPYMPVLGLLVIMGANFLHQKKQLALLVLLLAAMPALAALRIMPRWLKKDQGVPAELYNPDTRARLANAVPDTALSLVGPDFSACIFFYHLHKKGFNFSYPEQLYLIENGHTRIHNFVHQGARYLYTSDSAMLQDPRLIPYLGPQIHQTGSFKVLELKKPG